MRDRALHVSDLVRQVDDGALVLPGSERSFDWDRRQVALLVESLYWGRPAGGIALWSTTRPLARDAPVGRAGFTRRLSHVRRARRRWVVIDGQKRVGGMYRLLTGDPALRLRLHLDTESFELETQATRADPLWIDVSAVLSTAGGADRTLRQVRRALNIGAQDPRAARYHAVLQRLEAVRHHAFPAEVLESERFEDASETITRLNPPGGARYATEIAVLQLAFPWPRPLFDSLLDTLLELDEQRFGLPSVLLIRVLTALAVRSVDPDAVPWHEAVTPADLEHHWARTREGLLEAVALVREIGFDASGLIAHPAALIPLAVLSAEQRRLSPRHRAEARYWFLVATATERYARAPEHALLRDLFALASERPIEGLLRLVEPPSEGEMVPASRLEEQGVWSALFGLGFVVAKEGGAMDWFTGKRLTESTPTGRRQIGACHIFPTAVLRAAGFPASRANELANLAYLARSAERAIDARAPADYLPEVVERLGEEALGGQFVPLDRALWPVQRFEAFLAERRRLLAEAITRFIAGARPAGPS